MDNPQPTIEQQALKVLFEICQRVPLVLKESQAMLQAVAVLEKKLTPEPTPAKVPAPDVKK